MKKILVAVLLLASASCGYLVVRTHSFILGFYDIESMGGKLSDVNVSGEDCLRIDVYVKKARMVTDLFGNRPSENGSYDELCRKYGDLSYPERSFSSGSNPGAVYDCCYPNSDFMYVEVVSNLDWDTEHPAGSSLNDETWFTAVSAYPYIQSSYEMFGYDPDEWSEFFRFYSGGDAPAMSEWYPVDKPLSNLDGDDLILLGRGNELTRRGGVGFEDPDLLFYPPDIEPENKLQYNIFSLFIPAEPGKVLDLTVLLTDGNSETFRVDLKRP